MPKQKELPDMPKRSPAEDAAVEYVGLRKDRHKLNKQIESQGATLMAKMKEEKMRRLLVVDDDNIKHLIQIEGKTKISCRREKAENVKDEDSEE